jgi:hypothetical protein
MFKAILKSFFVGFIVTHILQFLFVVIIIWAINGADMFTTVFISSANRIINLGFKGFWLGQIAPIVMGLNQVFKGDNKWSNL